MSVFRGLLGAGGELSASEYVESLDLRSGAGARPYVVLNMIVSLDGRAAVAGRTAPLANAADNELFHALRGAGDAVMVGAATVRAEGYGELEQLAVVVSHSLDLPLLHGLLSHPANRVLILTDSERELGGCVAQVGYLRHGLSDGLIELRERHGVEAVVCEGGPHLNRALLADGLVDEIFVTIGGMIVGGEQPLTLVAGGAFEPPLRVRPIALLESEGFLFGRYRVQGR